MEKVEISRLRLESVLLLLISVFIVGTRQQDSFYFDPAPVSQDVVDGEPVRLRCDVSNRQQIAFYWTLNGKPVTNISRRFQEDSDLRIVWVDRLQDSGSLRCIATNVTTGIALRSAEAKLNILWIDKRSAVELKQPTELADIVQSTELQLKCQADGNPEPGVEWYRNSARLLQTDRVKFLKNRMLKITGLAASDNGVYSCKARSSAGAADIGDSFILNVPGPGVPRLRTETFMTSVVVKRGGQATLNCQYDGAARTEWYFDQRLITNLNRQKHQLQSNGSLTISYVDSRDAGTYRCVGHSNSGSSQTFSAELILAYLDDMNNVTFDPPPSTPQVIPVGGKLDVRCRVPKGLPEPTVRWTDPNGLTVVAVGDTDTVRVINNTLSLQNVAETETGNYTCHVDNMAASRSKSVAIVVSVPPKISLPPLSTRVTEGEEAVFNCKVAGTSFPVTTITWTYDERPIAADDERFSADVESGQLRIANAQLTDEGNYACSVLTTGHPAVVSSTARLYVEKQLRFKPVPVHTKLELGSPGRVACRADGRTAPTVRWLKDGRQGLPDHVTQNADGSLVFDVVEGGDAGQYTCVARNDQGIISATINIDVVVKPRFKVKPTNTTVAEGGFMMLHCVAIGDPTPTVHWDKNNRVDALDLNRFKILANGSLVVSEVFVEDTGKYGCTAGNNGGFTREEAYIHVTPGGDQPVDNGKQPDAGSDVTNTIVIAVCSVVAYLAVVVGLTVYCSLRLVRRKNRRKAAAAAAAQAGQDDKTGNGIIATEDTELMNREASMVKYDPETRSASSSNPSHSTLSNGSQTHVYEKLSYPRHQLQTLGILGKGQFGDVFIAKAFSIQNGISDTLVMVKSLLSQEDRTQKDFYHEMELYCRVNHDNVVKLLGLSREAFPVFAIYEYCDWGNLKHFLMSVGEPSLMQRSPSTAQRMSICRQVALGMSHVAALRIAHGDLAARNLVISSSLDIKISNPGLCVDIFAREYVVHRRQPVPLRWMPPELIQSSTVELKSLPADVWAYGVVIWELFTPGCPLPMAERSDAEILAALEAVGGPQNRLARPFSCPDDVWKIALRCMATNTSARPSFSQILREIDDMNLLDDSQV